MSNRRRIVVLMLVVLMLALPVVVLAQEGTPAPTDEAAELTDFVLYLMNQLGLTYLIAAMTVVIFAVEVLKRLQLRFVPASYRIHPKSLSIGLVAVLWLAYAATNQFGYGITFNNAVVVLTKLVENFGPMLLGILTTAFATQKVHNVIQASQTAGFGVKWEERNRAA